MHNLALLPASFAPGMVSYFLITFHAIHRSGHHSLEFCIINFARTISISFLDEFLYVYGQPKILRRGVDETRKRHV